MEILVNWTHRVVPETENRTCEVNFDCLPDITKWLKIITQIHQIIRKVLKVIE